MLKLVQETSARAEEAPTTIDLDELCRLAAKQMLATALLAERQAYLDAHADLVDGTGKRLVVANGYAKEREVTTGAGMVGVKAPRVDDRREGQHYRSVILPAYMRKSPKVTEVLPVLYLRGLSTGDFAPALGGVLRLGGGPVGLHGPAANRVLAGRARALGRPGPVRHRLRVLVGGRGPLQRPARTGPPVLLGHRRRPPRRHQRAGRPGRRLPGVKRVLGGACCAACVSAAWPARSWPSAMGRSASGPPFGTCSLPPKNRGAGSIKLPTASMRCQNAFSHRLNLPSRPSTTPARRTEALTAAKAFADAFPGFPKATGEDNGRARHLACLL